MSLKSITLSVIVAVALAAAVRFLFLMPVTITGAGLEPSLLQGDRAIVYRWAYGLRSPLTPLTGYSRLLPQSPLKGDWIAFNAPSETPTTRPDTGSLCVGRCIALAGDTVWMGAGGTVSPQPNLAGGKIWPVAVPRKGKTLSIHPWDARLYALTIKQREGRNATVRDGTLWVDGKPAKHYRFSDNYCWLSTCNDSNMLDSRSLGFIPEENIVGRLLFVLFSLDSRKPRWGRTFKAIGE